MGKKSEVISRKKRKITAAKNKRKSKEKVIKRRDEIDKLLK